MNTHGLDVEAVAQQLGADGVDNLVADAERVCIHERRHIELVNEGPILGLRAEYEQLLAEERRIEALLQSAPPSGDAHRLRRRAIYSWLVTGWLTISGFSLTMMTLAPFRFGWMSWVFAAGIALLTPYLVEKALERHERVTKVVGGVAAAAAVATLMFLADVRGNLLTQQLRQNEAPAVIFDDAPPQPETGNSFYDASSRSLHLAMLLLAFSMEVGAGLALREAWRSMPDSAEDWKGLRGELGLLRRRKAQIVLAVTSLRNAPQDFVARFWRDFYSALLTKAARNAMARLPYFVLGLLVLAAHVASAEDRLNLVIAIDLSQSVAVAGPDGKTEFEKNVGGVTRLLAQVPAGSHVTVIGITDHSFTQPYILLSAHVQEDAGYFGERLTAARVQLVKMWKVRAATLAPSIRQTDILGALHLASQLFDQDSDTSRKSLVIFSDMRQSTPELDLEKSSTVPSFTTVISTLGSVAPLNTVQVQILGADGAGQTELYWRSIQRFWTDYLQHAGAIVQRYSLLR